MVRIEKDYTDIGSKTNKSSVDIDISDRSKYPDGKYNIKATFDENNYYYKSEATLSPTQGETFSTSYTKINYSLDGNTYNDISNTNINAKYYDRTEIYFKLKYRDNDNNYTGNYTLNIKVYNSSDVLIKEYNLDGSATNSPKINDLYSLDVGTYKIVVSFNSPSNSRIIGCSHTLYYVQSKNQVAFYNFEKQGNNGVYNDDLDKELNTYVDQLDTVRQQLRTVDGDRSIPNNIEIDIKEGNNLIQTVKTFKDTMADASLIGDTNGCIIYTPQFANGTPTNIAVSSSIAMLNDNQEYIVQMNRNTYNITIGNYIKIEIKNTEQKITIDYNSANNDKLVFNKSLSIVNDHKIYITKHGNIFRVLATSGTDSEDNILLSIPKSFISGNIQFSINPVKITRYNLNPLTSSNKKIYSTEYDYVIKSDNFESNNNKLIINKLELEYDDNFDYLVDGYHNDKVINYFSTLTFDYQPKSTDSGVKIGYSVNGTQMNGTGTKNQSFTIRSRIPNLTLDKTYYVKFYIKKHHTCMYMIQIARKIYPIDWKITTTSEYLSEPNINLFITNTSNKEIKEPIKPNTIFNINCNTALVGRNINLLRKKGDGQYNIIYSGVTGEDGKFIKTGVTDVEEGTSYYKAQLTTYDNKIVESDEDYPITIFYSDTIITFNAFTKSSYGLNESITLTTVAKRNINGNYQNITETMNVKYYVIAYDDVAGTNRTIELGIKSTNANGQSSFVYDLNNLRTNNLSISDRVRFKAVLIGNNNYNTSEVESDFIVINKDSYNTTLTSVDTTVWGKGATLKAIVKDENDRPVSNIQVDFYDYDGTKIGSERTNSTGICSKAVLLPGIDENKKPGVYTFKAKAVVDNDYSTTNMVSKSITVTKRDVILTPIVNHVKSLVRGGTTPSEGIDTLFWDWQQRFKIIDTEGENIKGDPVLHITANGVNYDRTPNNNGVVGLNIHWHAHDGKGGKTFTETIECAYNGNDWYNAKTISKSFNYKLNDAVYASPGEVTQSDSSGNIDWNPDYLTEYNLRWDTIKGVQYTSDGKLRPDTNDYYLLTNLLSKKGDQPKTLNLRKWNEGTQYSFNRGFFVYDSNIISMYYIIEDAPYKNDVNKNHIQINNIHFSFGSNLPSFSSNMRYINQGFDTWGYRAYLYWENREKDANGKYIWLDNGDDDLRVWSPSQNYTQNSNFTPTRFTQARLLNEGLNNTIKYGINETDNSSGMEMLRRVYFVIAFIPKQININLSDCILNTSNLTKKYNTPDTFTATVTDSQGNPLNNDVVTFNVNGVRYERKTNAQGKASLNINLEVGLYTIYTSYMDSDGYVVENTNTITVTSD